MNPFDPQPTSYRGVVFPSQRALARYLGVSDKTVHAAVTRGTLDDWRIGHGRGVRHPCIIDGVAYASQREAARALGVHPSAISKRLARERNRP